MSKFKVGDVVRYRSINNRCSYYLVVSSHDKNGKQAIFSFQTGKLLIDRLIEPKYNPFSLHKKIQKFENIGEVGSTGNSVGPHLHFELRFKNNNRGSSVDPLPHFEDIPTNIYSSFSDTIIRR